MDYKKYNIYKSLPFFTVLLLFSILFGFITFPLFVVLLILKLIGVLTCSYWIVFLPIYYFIPLCGFGWGLDMLKKWCGKAKNS